MNKNLINIDNYNDSIIWKQIIIDDIPTNYEVNNIGQVRNKITRKVRKMVSYNHGYIDALIYINGKKVHQLVHRLVANAFIPNDDPINKNQVNHINGIKYDNRVENLEWVTREENMRHAYDNGLSKKGENHYHSIYSDKQIHEVCKLLVKKIPMNEIVKITGVANSTIRKIKEGENRKDISKLYDIDKSPYYYTKYTKNQIHSICKLLENHVSMKLITSILNIDKHLIRSIIHGGTWKSISSQYNIDYKKKYESEKIKYNKLKNILLELNIFNNIDLNILLDSKYIINKNKLINDMISQGYEIFIDSELYMEL